jgi:ABC-type Mn2+/Zn2+ transport system ATPase subunit
MNSDTVLSIKNGNFGYKKAGRVNSIVSDFSLDIQKGERVLLKGPNGSGKSTILKTVIGRLGLLSGQCIVNGKIAYVPQEASIAKDGCFTVKDVMMTASPDSWSRSAGLDVIKTLDHFGLSDIKHVRFSELSGGQRQLILIMRSFINKPDLVLLDEPVNHVDYKKIAEIGVFLNTISGENGTALLVTSHADGWFNANRSVSLCEGWM